MIHIEVWMTFDNKLIVVNSGKNATIKLKAKYTKNTKTGGKKNVTREITGYVFECTYEEI